MNVKMSSSSISACRAASASGFRFANGSLGGERGQVVVRQYLAQPGQVGAPGLDLGELLRVLAEHAHRVRVLEDVVHVLR